MSEIKSIIKAIEKNKNISIFFHVDPDFDALGSSYGLRSYLKQKYPGKNIMIIGLDFLDEKTFNDIFKYKGELTRPEFIEKSLGIVLDTANEERIFTSLNSKCKELIKIDHHPEDKPYGDLS
jgi:phosphoesterase RecJ-like protein